MFRRAIPSFVIAFVLVAALSPLAAAVTHRSSARFWGSPQMRGHARYIEKMINGQRNQRFSVHVARALPFQLLPVRVNGHMIGMIRANPAGIANLRLRSDGHGSSHMPGNFPNIRTGDVVSVGCMNGVCFEDGENGEFDLQGEVEDAGAHYQAEYQESMDDGALDREFKVEIEGAAADSTLDVFVDDVLVGSVTTDALGNAVLKFESGDNASGDDDANDDDDGGAEDNQPFPDTFPAVTAGSVVRVGDVVITLNAGNGGGDDDNNGDDDDNGDDDNGGGGNDDGD
jgi:hypothetical protein